MDPELDDWCENFGKVGEPGSPHPLADGFEQTARLARAAGNLDGANLMQEMANMLRQRVRGANAMFRGIPCPEGPIIPPSSHDGG